MSNPLPTSAELAAQIVSAYCSGNAVAADELPALIGQVHVALTQLGQPEQVAADKPIPVVHPKKSVFSDYIICMEDGVKLKMLKRHLRIAYDLTPTQYRERWNLPPDYPMVAPNYAEKRSALAKKSGLGRKPDAAASPDEADVPAGGESRRS